MHAQNTRSPLLACSLSQGGIRREYDEDPGDGEGARFGKEEFAARVRQFAEVTDQLEKKGKDNAQGEKKKAALELADVVRKHNAKYNEMLQQRMAEGGRDEAQLQKEHEKMLADAKKGSSDDKYLR